MLTDERLAEATFGRSASLETKNGLRYWLAGRFAGDDPLLGELHRDQCLATFAMLGCPVDERISLKSGSCTLQEFLDESVANFTFDQAEPFLDGQSVCEVSTAS